jgi:tetratricopeptide (TPR) repeat protein
MVGSIFRIADIYDDGYSVWIVRMILCSDDDHDLADMGKFDEAEKYYLRLLNHLSPNDPDVTRCYYDLGNVTDEKGDYDSSLEWHKKSLNLRIKALKSDHPHLAPSYISIGCAHFNKGDYEQALESYKEAYKIIGKVFRESHPDIAIFW